MGVLLTAAAIAASIGVGVWSEHRWRRGAAQAARRALLVILYAVLPVVYFLNLYGPALIDRLLEELPIDPGQHWVLAI